MRRLFFRWAAAALLAGALMIPAAEAAQLRQDPATVDRGTDRPRRGREAERLRRELNDLD